MPLFLHLHKADILKLHLHSVFLEQYAPTDVIQVLKFRSGGGGGHGAYDQRIKVIAKMLKQVGWLREGWGSGLIRTKN